MKTITDLASYVSSHTQVPIFFCYKVVNLIFSGLAFKNSVREREKFPASRLTLIHSASNNSPCAREFIMVPCIFFSPFLFLFLFCADVSGWCSGGGSVWKAREEKGDSKIEPAFPTQYSYPESKGYFNYYQFINKVRWTLHSICWQYPQTQSSAH